MPTGLKRYQDQDHDHLITFSCHHRRPYLTTPESRDLFERSLEQTRRKYHFEVIAYVVMPEHVHLLVSEPHPKPIAKQLATAMGALKLSVSKQSPAQAVLASSLPRFQRHHMAQRLEKMRYIHRDPVARGLVCDPEDWPHSSYLTYLHGEQRTVQIAL